MAAEAQDAASQNAFLPQAWPPAPPLTPEALPPPARPEAEAGAWPGQQECLPSLPDAVIPRDQSEELDAEEEEDLAPEDDNDLTTAEAGWKVVMEHLQGSGTPRRMCSSHTIWGPLPLQALSWFLTLPVLEEELVMGANPRMCFTAQKRGQDNLELPSSNAALAERIAGFLLYCMLHSACHEFQSKRGETGAAKATGAKQRVLLAAVSPYFKDVFTSFGKESQGGEVVLQDMAPSILQSILQYIYTEELSLSLETAPDLFAAASKLQIRPLVEICCRCFDEQ
ncbi:Kelch repeat and BTB domain-containing protein 5 [Chelonia mydas]|uniref:Kelch repeat and BTB domain-containing protein 5 n=1 Tax=Chelonia mydas TaxID=8469 RepID=M7BW58_CHEMY|nr:Kelch repeat and BTB domain-containing protein 5 [Chelonia mydas]